MVKDAPVYYAEVLQQKVIHMVKAVPVYYAEVLQRKVIHMVKDVPVYYAEVLQKRLSKWKRMCQCIIKFCCSLKRLNCLSLTKEK